MISIADQLAAELGEPKPKPLNGAARPSGDSPFTRANAADVRQVASRLGLVEGEHVRCPGCDTVGDSSVAFVGNGVKCLHDRCADKGKAGFRTCVDLVAEARNESPRDAVNTLAGWFNFEGFANPGNEPTRVHVSAAPPLVWTPANVLAAWAADGPLVHEPTGIDFLDTATDGGPPYGTRWYVQGAPDAAKTALLLQIADVLLSRGIAVGLLAVDEEAGDLVMRFLQRRGYSRRACELRDPMVLREMQTALAGLHVRFYDHTHTIDSAGTDLAAYAKVHCGGRAMLGVDSIQVATCAAEQGAKSLREAVTMRTKALRDVATQHKLIAIATSEMARGAYRSKDSAEQSNDLASAKESGAIEYSARALISLRSVQGEPDLIEVRIPKNKHGPKGEVFHLRLDRASQTLRQVEAPDRQDAAMASNDRAMEKVKGDAAMAANVVAARQGLGVREYYAELRSTYGSFSTGRADAALARLGPALVRVSGRGRSIRLGLNGESLAPDILALVPDDVRDRVRAAKWEARS